MKFISRILFIFAFMVVSPAQANSVGDACTVANRIHTSEGATTDVLICDGATMTLQTARSLKGNPVREGIRTATPATTLDVNGEVKVGNTSIACSVTKEGAIRYNSTDKVVEVCNGTAWVDVAVGTCDNAPAFPSFPDNTNVTLSTLTTSDIVNITGMDAGCTVTVGVSGTGGSPQYRTCSDAACSTEVQTWTNANNVLDIQGDYIQLRATSPGAVATTYTITVDIGPSVSSDWNITTGISGCSPEGTVCADGTVYAGLSGASTAMYVTRCDAGMTWGGSSCTGTRLALPWNNGNSTGFTSVATSLTDGQANTATLIATDSDSVIAGQQQHQAAQYCADLSLNGHSDWYFPAKTELNTIYTNEAAIGGFDTSGSFYWASTEYDIDQIWRQRFSNGEQNVNANKASSANVRCARR